MLRSTFAVAMLLAALATDTIAGQEGPTAPTDQERSAIIAEIEAVVNSIRSPTDWEPHLAQDAEFVDFATLYAGRQAVIEHLSDLRSGFSEWEDSEWEDLSVEVLSSEAALVTGQFSVHRTLHDGPGQEGHAIFTGLFERAQGQWLVSRGHLSGSIQTVDDE